MSKKIIGIDLGGTSIKFAIVSQEGEVQEKWSITTNILEEGKHIVPSIIQSIKEHLELYQMQESDFIGIGLGTPGAVNAQKGTVIGAYNLNWSKLQEVRTQMNQAFEIPFFIDNDANVAALGEQWMGAGDGKDNVVMFTLGTGVGGGIVIDGKLIRGVGGCAGEIGHLTVDAVHGFDCTCGKKGCLETVASATGIVNLARKYAEEFSGPSQIKADIDDGLAVSSKSIFDAAKQGDLFANHVVDQFAMYLGLACSHVAHTINPSTIVLGGGVSAAGDYLLERVQKYYDQFSFKQVKESTKIALAQLGNDAGILGAAQLVRSES